MNLSFRVVSDSMTPLIGVNDTLQISRQKSYSPFDIILFKRSARLVVHYVWRNQLKFNQTVVTRSFKNIYCDEEPVHSTEIVGLVTNYKIGPIARVKIVILCFLRGAL